MLPGETLLAIPAPGGHAMTLIENLTRLQRSIPGCSSVLYGDLGTATVLRAFSEAEIRQEVHDATLAQAALCFGPLAEGLLARASGQGGPDRPAVARAVVCDARQTRIFLRPEAEPEEVVCLTLRPDTPVSEVTRALEALEPEDD